jgi:PAS domain-containing protein
LEQVQRKNEEVLRTLLNSIPESAFLMQPDGTIVVANSTLAKRFNYASEKDLVGVKLVHLRRARLLSVALNT